MWSKIQVVSSGAVVLGLVYLFMVAVPVRAASGLTISPPLREITIGPGLLETTADITLQNNTDQSIKSHLRLVDFSALGEFGGASVDKAGLSDQYNLANWMTLPEGDSVVIAKGETVKVKVKITNREDLTPGGHYGAVVITTDSETAGKSNLSINQQLISLLFVKKLGGEVFGLNMEPLSYKGSQIPQQLTTRFKSTGNVHVVPRGYIEVTDPAGKVVSKGILNQDSSMILPGTTRQFVTLMQPVADSNRPGQYKITVYYRYDGQQEFSAQAVYFTRGGSWVVGVITGGILLISLVAVVIVVRRRKRKSKDRR